jgi:hypothetical protein
LFKESLTVPESYKNGPLRLIVNEFELLTVAPKLEKQVGVGVLQQTVVEGLLPVLFNAE